MLDEYMISMGFNDKEIFLIKKAYPINKYAESTILYNLKNISNYLLKNSLTNNDIINITLTSPNIIFLSIE